MTNLVPRETIPTYAATLHLNLQVRTAGLGFFLPGPMLQLKPALPPALSGVSGI